MTRKKSWSVCSPASAHVPQWLVVLTVRARAPGRWAPCWWAWWAACRAAAAPAWAPSAMLARAPARATVTRESGRCENHLLRANAEMWDIFKVILLSGTFGKKYVQKYSEFLRCARSPPPKLDTTKFCFLSHTSFGTYGKKIADEFFKRI